MKKKEILRNLIDKLTDKLEAYDFQPSYKKQGFIKATSTTIFVFQFLIYDRTVIGSNAKGFLMEPYAWITLLEIEKYYKEITSNTQLKEDVDFITVGNSIANLLANPDGLYSHRNKSLDLHVFRESDIDLVSDNLFEIFKKVAVPYFANNASIQMIDKLVNSKPNEYKVHTQNDNYRILKGLIAAKLNGNPRLEELIQIYDKQILERDMYNAVTEMEKLKLILPTIRPKTAI